MLFSGSFTAVLVLLPARRTRAHEWAKHGEGAELHPKCRAINSWAGSSLGTIFLVSLTPNEVQADLCYCCFCQYPGNLCREGSLSAPHTCSCTAETPRWSQGHRIVWVREDLIDDPVPIPLPWGMVFKSCCTQAVAKTAFLGETVKLITQHGFDQKQVHDKFSSISLAFLATWVHASKSNI